MAITNASDLFNVYFLLIILAALVFRLFIKTHLRLKPSNIPSAVKAPPSPLALPIIGHLHLIGSVLPKSFQTLARLHGPLMQLRLGFSSCVVVSDSDVAKEIFKTQELNFSSRPEFGSSEYFIYRGSRFVTAQYSDYWRFMKKLCMTRLLAVPQLDRSIGIRQQEVSKLFERVSERSRERQPCDLSTELTALTNNVICRMAMSSRCSGSGNEAEKIKMWVHHCLMLAGKLSSGDILGPFRFLDFSGNGKKLVSALKCFDQLVENILRQREANSYGSGSDEKTTVDLVDILLETYSDPTAELRLSRNDIKSFLLVSFSRKPFIYSLL